MPQFITKKKIRSTSFYEQLYHHELQVNVTQGWSDGQTSSSIYPQIQIRIVICGKKNPNQLSSDFKLIKHINMVCVHTSTHT